MSKYDEAVNQGFTDDQIVEYFKPKAEQALASVGEDKTKEYLVAQMGMPPSVVSRLVPTQNKEATSLFKTIPKRIQAYEAAGLSRDEAFNRAKEDSYKERGITLPTAEAQFNEHVWTPFKEGLATVGAGFASLVDDLTGFMRAEDDYSKNLSSAKQALADNEREYEKKYGLDVVREVTKALPAIVTIPATYSSFLTTAAAEGTLSYGMARGENKPVGDALLEGSVAAAIPAGLALAKGVKTVLDYPAAHKTKLLNQVTKQARKDMLDVLEYAENKGFTLTPAQLSDNAAIEQLTDIVSRNPLIKKRFDDISNQNKAVLLNAFVELKQSMSQAEVGAAFVKGEVDPFGRKIQETLKEAKAVRSERTKEAYQLFDELAADITVPQSELKNLASSLKAIKAEAKDMNDPEAYMAVMNSALRRIKNPETSPAEFTRSLTDMLTAKRPLQQDTPEFKDLSLKDLNTVSKQLYKLSKNVEDPTLKRAWGKVRSEVNDLIGRVAAGDEDVAALLETARQRHIQKEKLYGLKPDYKQIAQTVDSTSMEDVVDNLLKGKNARTNALKLRQEFNIASKPEMSQQLAKRYIEDAFTPDVKEFKDMGALDPADIFKLYSKIDPEVVKLLAGDSAAKELRILAKLAKSSAKLDKLTNYKIMTGTPNYVSYIGDLIRGAVQGRLVGNLLSSDKAQKAILKIYSGRVSREEALNLVKDAARAAGVSDSSFKPHTASSSLGVEPIVVYRASNVEKGRAKGAMGDGVYYFTDKANAVDRAAGTDKQIFETEVNPDNLATMDTVSYLLKREAKYKDLSNPKIAKELKLRGFEGVYDSGEIVLF